MGIIDKESEGFRILAGGFPMVRCNGNTFLFQEKLVCSVESDLQINGIMVFSGYFVQQIY